MPRRRLRFVPSLETRLPLLAAVADGPAGKLPASQTGLALSRRGVLVTAFGADPDGVNQGTLLRVWNQSGDSGPLHVRLPAGLKAERALPVNLAASVQARGFRLWIMRPLSISVLTHRPFHLANEIILSRLLAIPSLG